MAFEWLGALIDSKISLWIDNICKFLSEKIYKISNFEEGTVTIFSAANAITIICEMQILLYFFKSISRKPIYKIHF